MVRLFQAASNTPVARMRSQAVPTNTTAVDKLSTAAKFGYLFHFRKKRGAPGGFRKCVEGGDVDVDRDTLKSPYTAAQKQQRKTTAGKR